MKKLFLYSLIFCGISNFSNAQNSSCGSCNQPGLNLANNGDFSNANAGFTNNLTYSAAGTSSPGKYAIRSQANTFWIGGCSVTDHTTGGGTGMLCVDAKTNGLTIAWDQTITGLSANQDYILSFYTKFAICIASGAVPTIKVLVNAVQVGDTFNIRVGSWRQVSFLWNSGNATSAVIQILDTVQGGAGNDFIIDDISFSPCISNQTADAGTDEFTCAGTDVPLSGSGSGAGTCTWTGPAGLDNYNTCNPVFNSAIAGDYTYILTYTTATCNTNDTVNIHVDALPPTPVIYQYGDTLISDFATGYQWYNTAGIINGATSQYYLPIVGGYYQLLATDQKGCSSISDSVLFVPCQQYISVYTLADTAVCEGSPVYLSTSGNGSGNCIWTGPAGLSLYSICNPVFTSNTAGDFTYIVTDELNGCFNSDTLTIHVDALPPKPVISQNGDTLASSIASAYQWYFAGNILTGETDSILIATQAGSYSVTVIDPKGCNASSDPYSFSPCSQIIQVQATADTAICSGTSVNLSTSGNGSGNCIWSGPVGLDTYTNCNPAFTGSSTGSFTYIVTDTLSGCQGSDTVVIQVLANPLTPIVTLAGDSLISTTATTYQWYNVGNMINGETNNYYVPTQAGYYYVVTFNAAGCSATSDSVYFSPCNQIIIIQTIPDTTICAGTPVTLITNGNGLGNCVWNGPSGLDNYNTCEPVFNTLVAGDYLFYVTDMKNGCEGIDSVNIHVNDLPLVPTVTQQNDSLIALTGLACQWYSAGVALANATQYYFLATQHGYYHVVVTDQNGCTAVSDSLDPFFTGIQDQNGNPLAQLHYNSLSGQLGIHYTGNDQLNTSLFLYDITGKKIVSVDFVTQYNQDITMDVSKIKPGIYIIRLVNNRNTWIRKIMIR